MKKFSYICSILIIVFLFMTATAFSIPFSDNVTNDVYSGIDNGIPTANTTVTPNIYEAINKILGTGYSSNAAVDHLFMDYDSLWFNFGGSATVIGYSAYYHDTLGVYYAGGSLPVLENQHGYGFADGTDSQPTYPTKPIDVPDGTVFGWYLEVTDPGPNGGYVGTYYSESDHPDNLDGYDHMMTFDLGGSRIFNGITYQNPYLIAWEDSSWSSETLTLGDEDYNDLIFLVDAKIVPEPATVLLLGSGLLGLAGLGRKRKRAFKNS